MLLLISRPWLLIGLGMSQSRLQVTADQMNCITWNTIPHREPRKLGKSIWRRMSNTWILFILANSHFLLFSCSHWAPKAGWAAPINHYNLLWGKLCREKNITGFSPSPWKEGRKRGEESPMEKTYKYSNNGIWSLQTIPVTKDKSSNQIRDR